LNRNLLQYVIMKLEIGPVLSDQGLFSQTREEHLFKILKVLGAVLIHMLILGISSSFI